jgi:hypothetical protein
MGWYKLDPVVREEILRRCRQKEEEFRAKWKWPSRRSWPSKPDSGEAEFERGLWRAALE